VVLVVVGVAAAVDVVADFVCADALATLAAPLEPQAAKANRERPSKPA
jgi:hypothetical protein